MPTTKNKSRKQTEAISSEIEAIDDIIAGVAFAIDDNDTEAAAQEFDVGVGDGAKLVSLPLHQARKHRVSVHKAQMALFDQEEQGHFTSSPVKPGGEFPTVFTRAPIFLPLNRKRQAALLNDQSLHFETSWGVGIKTGPALTTFDEDTLIGLMRLRQRQLVGAPEHMPIQIPNFMKRSGTDDVAVHTVHCTISDIDEALGRGTAPGGQTIKERLASIKRLASTTLELKKLSSSGKRERGTMVRMFDVLWDHWDEDGVIYVQFTPVIVQYLTTHYTILDLSVRNKLSPTGKTIHRFLSSQSNRNNRTYKIGVTKLMQVIGYVRDQKYFHRDLKNTLERLVNCGWLDDWEITGGGRGRKYVLTVTRSKTSFAKASQNDIADDEAELA